MGRVAVLLGPDFEDSEFRKPVDRLKERGHRVDVLGKKGGETLDGKRGDEKVKTDAAVGDRRPKDYDAILIPGGYSPDQLRTDAAVIGFLRDFHELDRPIAAVCHAPSLLIEADIVKGRTMTSWPSIRTDLINAGATVVDREVCEDGNLITSRKPDDLEAFGEALLRRLAPA